MRDFFELLAVGKTLMFFLRKFPPAVNFANSRPLLKELLECDLCLGFWIFTGTGIFTGVNIGKRRNLFGSVVTGAVSSLVAHLLTIGWKEQFGVFEIK